MKRSITITPAPIDEPALVAERAMSAGMGAALYFTGVVRGTEGSDAISGLDYEAFEPMAHHQFNLILDEIERRWPIESVRLVHRIGPVRANEASLWVEVISSHVRPSLSVPRTWTGNVSAIRGSLRRSVDMGWSEV